MSLLLLPCLRCGHDADAHEVVDVGTYLTNDGAVVHDRRLGRCLHVDPDLFSECPCSEWDPDTLSRVTELLGLDVRRVV